jgi:hypothetical protein
LSYASGNLGFLLTQKQSLAANHPRNIQAKFAFKCFSSGFREEEFLNICPIWYYVKMSCSGGHLEFMIDKKYLEDRGIRNMLLERVKAVYT